MALEGLTKITSIGLAGGIDITGITTTHGMQLSGITTGLAVSGVATFTDNVTVAGTLTYEDVTNIDSVGIITARKGISVSGGGTLDQANITGVSTFGGTLKIPTVAGTNNAAFQSVLFQTAAGIIDGGSGLQYHPANDQLSVNGTTITSGSVYSNGGSSLKLADANYSSTTYALISNKVEIGVNDNVAGAFKLKQGSNEYITVDTTNSSEAIKFGTAGTERVRITSTGKVGIGTNPTYNLDIQDGTSARVAIDVSTGSDASIYMDGINADFAGSDYYSVKAQSSGEFAIFKAASERLRITSDGHIIAGGQGSQIAFNNVGNDAFGCVLEIDGSHTTDHHGMLSLVGKTDTDAGSTGKIQFINSQNSSGSSGSNAGSKLVAAIEGRITTSDSNAGDDSGGYLRFTTKAEAGGNAEAMRITSTGVVGINQSSPDSNSMLDVTSDKTGTAVNTNRVALFRTNGAGRDAHITLSNSSNTPVHIGQLSSNLYFTTNNAERLRITNGGDVRIMTANGMLKWTAASGDDPFIRSIGSNQQEVEFNTGGSERLRIKSDGTLRVGGSLFTDTDVRLQIHNPANTASQLQFTGTATGGTSVSRGFRVGYNGSGGQLWNFEDNYVRISTNNAEKIRVHNRQLTTIGYTGDPGWSTDTGYYNVVLGNSGYFRADTDGSGNFLSCGVNAYRGSSAWQLKETGRATQINHSSSGTIEFYVSASGSANNNVTWNDYIMKITHEKVVIGHSDTEWLEIPHDERCIVFDQGQKMITSNDGQGNFNIIGGKNHEAVHVSSDSGNSGIAQIQLDTDGVDGNIQFGVGPTRGAGSAATFVNGFKIVHQSSGLNGLRYITGSNSAPSGLSSEYVILNKGNCEDGSWNTDSEAIFKTKGDGGSISLTTNDGGGNCNVCFNCASEVADTTGSAWRIRADIDSANSHFYIQNDQSCSNGGATGMTNRFEISESGTFSGSSSNNISDVRLKKNIATITNATAKIKELKGRTFEWKEEARLESGIQYGFIAQEMETVVSDLVTDGTKSGLRSFDKDGNVLMDNYSVKDQIVEYSKGVNVDGVVPILVEALKEAIAKIETLETKVANLES